MPFASYQLSALVLSNAKLRKHFSSNAVAIFSSNVFKNVTIQFIKILFYYLYYEVVFMVF